MKSRVAVIASFLLTLCAAKLLAQSPPAYLAEMPSIERVMQVMRTGDPDETAARQMAAFTHLKNMIEKLAGPRFPKNQLTPEENKLRQVYYTAYWQIAKSKPQYGPFTAMRGLDIDIKFRDELIQKCFPPSFAAEYSKLTGQAIAQNQAFHEQGAAARQEREQARADAAAKEVIEHPDAQQVYAGVQKQLESAQLQSLGLFTPEQARCVAAGRPEASCMGNALLGGFTQLISSVLPEAGKQSSRPSGPTMSGVFVGPGNWRIDFMHDGVLVNCAMLSPNEETYAVKFENGRALVVINTTPKPLVLTLTADGNLVGRGPIVIDGVIATGYHRGISDAVSEDQYGNKYNMLGNKATETAGYDTFSPKQTTCPAQNLSSKGAGTGVETMEFNVLKMAIGADQGPPIPPGVRMNGMYAANTGFNVEFFPESAIVACGQPARAYPYHVVANGLQAAIKIDDPTRPLLLSFRPDGSLDPGSGSYLVHGRKIVGKDVHDNFIFAPFEATCNLGPLVPGAAPPASAPAQINASAGSAAAGGSAGGSPGTAPAAAAAGPSDRIATLGAPTGNAVLSIVSGLPGQPNARNPLASGPFVLARDSFATVFSRAGIQVPAGTTPQLIQFNACSQRTPDCQRILQAFQGNVAAATTPDPLGKATFAGVPPGPYYVIASATYNNQKIYWELKVDLKAGANAATLDERNGNLLYPTAPVGVAAQPRPAPNPTPQPANSSVANAVAYIQQGSKDLDAKQYDKAIEAFKSALALDPKMFAAYSGLGRAYVHAKRYKEAVPPLQEAVRLKPDDEISWFMLGAAFNLDGQYQSALQPLEQAVRLNPADAEARKSLGLNYNALEQNGKAKEQLQEAVRLDPSDAVTWGWLGKVRFALQQYADSAQALDRALRLDPNDSEADYLQGRNYIELKQYDKAIASLKEAVRIDPKDASSWSYLALAYLTSEQFPQAVAAVQEQIRLDPNADAYFMLGTCYVYMDKKQEALAVYQKLLTMDKKSASDLYADISKMKQRSP